MRVVAITGVQQCALVERPRPEPVGDLVVVRNQVAPMCTEYKAYRSGHSTDCLGHEAAGEVVAVAQPGRVAVGDRVVVMPMYSCGRCPLCLRGEYIHCTQGTWPTTGVATYAEYVTKADWQCVPIPDDIALEHAALACCGLGPTFGAQQRMGITALDTLLITGMGPVGLGGVINGVVRGARVLAVESVPYRAALARELGAAAVFDPNHTDVLAQIREATGGIGPDAGIDCTGVAVAQRLLIDAVRRRGQVAFVGEGGDVPVHVSNDLIRKGLTLHGQWHWPLYEAPRLFEVIRRAGPLLDRFITHRFSLDQVEEAFALQQTGACGKVLLLP